MCVCVCECVLLMVELYSMSRFTRLTNCHLDPVTTISTSSHTRQKCLTSTGNMFCSYSIVSIVGVILFEFFVCIKPPQNYK